MKSTEILFWTMLIAIAAFYIIKGNAMHEERLELIKEKHMEHNKTK